MKIRYILSIIILLIISLSIILYIPSNNNIDFCKSVLVANTPTLREKGLSGMESLPEDSTIFFVFDKPDKYGIWMKDMNFPIDIIWLDKDYEVIHIEENIPPDSYPKIYYPEDNSLYIIETNANYSSRNNIKKGSILNVYKNCD